MKVKICGITRAKDAVYIAKCGGWAIGFVFYKDSPRYLSPEKAGSIVKEMKRNMDNKTMVIGVFVNSPLDEIENIISMCNLDMVQLHGNEDYELCQKISVPFIKAIRPRSAAELLGLEKIDTPNYLLVDAFDEKIKGGTGKQANWKLALAAKEKGRVILSGGLDCGTVQQAIRSVKPAAIDLSSGVEISPGIKDHGKINELFRITRGVSL